MLKVLTDNEIASVSGAAKEVIPPTIPGYALIGWSEEIIGYDNYEWTEFIGVFTKVIHKETFPIIDIQPLYTPVVMVF
ncbi:MAG: hypothetical protein JSS07_11550 [Proteobacteria bacterium]|nr:hypothetical protein [Pseudomonadota bacterium]